jgi:DNA-binding transcriptional LysR family regulator
MQDIDTALLRTFVVLAEVGSFSRTAHLIGRTQSAVTSQIAKLEQHLGVSLFSRTTRSVTLTVDGEILCGMAREVLQLCEALLEHSGTGELQGEVRFGAPEDFASQWLPEVLARFATSHPKVRLHVECDFTRLLQQRYDQGSLDVVILKQKPGTHHPAAMRLWEESLVWVGPSGQADNRFYDFSRTDVLPLVLSPAPCVYRARAIMALEAARMRWHDVFTSPSHAGMVAAVKAGLGVAVLASTGIPEGLCPLEGFPHLEPADLVMIERPGAGLAARALGQHLADIFCVERPEDR